jgi:sugar/nucleoside kinase (ribokinase family)
MATKVLVIGDLVVDIILGRVARLPAWGKETEVDSCESRLGGNAGNFALAARSIGLDVHCAGPIGDDDNGDRVERELRALGCNTQLVRRMPGSTCISVGLVRDDGERLFVTYPGVLNQLAEFIRQMEPPAIDVAFLSGWCQPPRIAGSALAEFCAGLSGRKIGVVMDLSWTAESWNHRPELIGVLRQADFVLLNRDELGAIVGHRDLDKGIASLAAELGKRPAVIVKLGPDGAAGKHGGGAIVRARAPAVGSASSVGAGDSFNAAFVAASFHRQLGLARAIEHACEFASETMRKGRPPTDVGSRSAQ